MVMDRVDSVGHSQPVIFRPRANQVVGQRPMGHPQANEINARWSAGRIARPSSFQRFRVKLSIKNRVEKMNIVSIVLNIQSVVFFKKAAF